MTTGYHSYNISGLVTQAADTTTFFLPSLPVAITIPRVFSADILTYCMHSDGLDIMQRHVAYVAGQTQNRGTSLNKHCLCT